MRLSKFQIKTIWFIGLTVLLITVFKLELKNDLLNMVILLFKIFSVFFMFIWTVGLSETLKEIVGLKYKIVVKKYSVQAKYLTFWWIFIPCWKAIDYDYHSCEVQNLFGATMDSGYSIDVTYNSEKEAISAIEKHKQTIAENRKDWFERPTHETKQVKYM